MKFVERMKKAHSPVSLNDFKLVADYFGFSLDHITGSHHVFRNWTGKKYVVPVHDKKIKAV
jgi:predicted RNA binding protein YcfA (HicA-like mRNA interferase family)